MGVVRETLLDLIMLAAFLGFLVIVVGVFWSAWFPPKPTEQDLERMREYIAQKRLSDHEFDMAVRNYEVEGQRGSGQSA